MNFRENTPERSHNVAPKKDYHDYRDQLSTDFNHRCGYCNDRDAPRASSFEIDHFVPKKVDGSRVTDYTNLVYACRLCNNAKRAKWPTGDKNQPNDGKAGWIDPCSEEYGSQFERLEDGKIHPLSDIGEWMYDNLKLWKKQHEVLWNCEQLEANIDKLYNLYVKALLPNEHKDILIQLYQQHRKVLHAFYSV